MAGFKTNVIRLSDRAGLTTLTHGRPDGRLTTILYHGFRFGEEGWAAARERLKRQCAFLREAYEPMGMDAALARLGGAARPGRPVLVTIDDAKREIAEVLDVFEAHEIPLTQFVCAGWSEVADDDHAEDAAAVQLVSRLHFWDGEARKVVLDSQSYTLDHEGNVALIDAVIGLDAAGRTDEVLDALEDVFRAPCPRDDIGGWDEVREQHRRGVTIGCHSVSHAPIARQSPRRQRFEIEASRALIERRVGPCAHFAYPYGTPESHDAGTEELLRAAGFEAGFTTEPAFAAPGAAPLTLPRIALPDEPMSDAVFRARVRGGGIPLTQMKARVRRIAGRGRA